VRNFTTLGFHYYADFEFKCQEENLNIKVKREGTFIGINIVRSVMLG
jgi:hypothetical protein